jgi:hypothetical protein
MANYSKNPSSFMRLIACGQESIGSGAAEDLATYLDITPYEYLLCTFTCSVIGTSTALTIKAMNDTVSTGASAVTVKDRDGNDLSTSLPATSPTLADGNTVAMQVRTRGMKKFFSPQLQATTAAMGVAYQIWGIGVRDTSELAAGWVAGDESSAVVAEAAAGNAFT